MNRHRSPAETAHALPATANQPRPETQAANKQLASASSGEYAESVAEDWTPEDDSPPDTPDRSAPLTTHTLCYVKPLCALSGTDANVQPSRNTAHRAQRVTDIHALTAADLLEKFLGPSSAAVDGELVSADGALKRANPVPKDAPWIRGPHAPQPQSSRERQASAALTR